MLMLILAACRRCGGQRLLDDCPGWGVARWVCAQCGWDGLARRPTDEERRAAGEDADEGLLRLLRAILADYELDGTGEVWRLIEPLIPGDFSPAPDSGRIAFGRSGSSGPRLGLTI